MGYWTNTTYLATGDADAVARLLTRVLAEEGMRPVARPAERARGAYEPMQYAPSRANDLWGLAVFPGAAGWTVIKTAPLSLLGERGPGATRMRLVELCARAGAPGFHLAVYDSTGGVLAETDGAGALSVSGLADGGDPLDFHGEPIPEARVEMRFGLLPLGALLDVYRSESGGFSFVDLQGFAEALEGRLGGDNASFCDNLTSVDTLVRHLPLHARGGRELYLRRAPLVAGAPGAAA